MVSSHSEVLNAEGNKVRLFSLVSTLLSDGTAVLDQSHISLEWLFDNDNALLLNEAFRELSRYATPDAKARAFEKIMDVKNILGFDLPGWVEYLK